MVETLLLTGKRNDQCCNVIFSFYVLERHWMPPSCFTSILYCDRKKFLEIHVKLDQVQGIQCTECY